MNGRPRVLLVEDDPSIRRFVGMALEALPVALTAAANLAEARVQLQSGPFALLITDLMLPDGSGLDLLQQLCEQQPQLRQGAELAVFSAGITEVVRARLAGWGVHRVLSKPITLADLERHVLECIPAASVTTQAAQSPHPQADIETARQAAVKRFFGGDMALFAAFEQTCHAQFPRDIDMADAAAAAADLAGLRRVVHSLKTVLLTLGFPDLSAVAAQAEEAAAAAAPTAVPLWHQLRAPLEALSAPRQG